MMNLEESEIQIWQGDLDSWTPHLPRLTALLSHEELERSRRYHFERDRRHFAIGRALLRFLLGSFLEKEPRTITLPSNEYGRPQLGPRPMEGACEFNISHSGGHILMAFSLRQRIGVDLEQIRTDVSFDSIAERYFSEEEKQAISAENAENKPQVFFRYWTLKEAFIKAQGKGLSYPLNQFTVRWNDKKEEAALFIPQNSNEASNWSLFFLKTPPFFLASLAVEGQSPLLRYHSLKEIDEKLKPVKDC